MTYIDYKALESANVAHDPFNFLIVPNFIPGPLLKNINADFPKVPGPGSHPPSELSIEGHFKGLMNELEGEKFRRLVEEKFELDLEKFPTMYTVRGFLRRKDGSVHTDSKTKIITVLLYLNEKWENDGGRLRLLRNGTDIENYVTEIPPYGGSLLIFQRSDNSWHGHKPYVGQRRAIQMNWVTSQEVVDHEQSRHRFSTRLKKLKGLFLPTSY